jgi:5,5'-dehydrodivanillate O-demethylase oxygenase subunit
MLTHEDNEFLTRVGPGTPAGELLRRYWHPIAVAKELTPEQPTKFVRVLGEDLVLFLDKSGRVGLLADHCSHRSASLLYGRVEERGIACAYHGWLYDTQGNILETPPERNDAIMKSVKQPAYPVRKYLGLYWAYMGPQPAPMIPRYDIWDRKDGRRKIVVYHTLDCNWLQAAENGMDPAHLQILHQEFVGGKGRKPASTTRGFTDDIETFEFIKLPFGFMKRRTYRTGIVDEHPLIFPSMLRQGSSTQIRVPTDDTHCWDILIRFSPTPDGSIVEDDDPEVQYFEPHKEPLDKPHPFTRFTMHMVHVQDMAAWETQGPITDRSVEHLSYSDRGIALLRRAVREEIEKVQQGLDPMGVVRDPNHAMIDTGLDATLKIEAMEENPSAQGRAAWAAGSAR